ncbi:MAG: glycoside hydrolase [Pirellulales bacterium]|nr:glycoside hydrolase [Pirellulales bacterium]
MGKIDIFTVVEAPPERPRHGAGTIVELNDGKLLLAWMEHVGGDTIGHDHAPCNIAQMTSSDGGYTWEDRKIFVENAPGDVNIHYPCFGRLNNGEILFCFQRLHLLAPGKPQSSTSFSRRSADDGKTFSEPVMHNINQKRPIAAYLLTQLSTGRIIHPLQQVLGDWCGPTDHQINSCAYSDDLGHTWKQSENWVDLPMRGAMEPHIVELSDGRLLMYMGTQLGAIFQSTSYDGAVTWSSPQTTGLRAPESMPCLVKFPHTGDLLVIWNHSTYDPNFDHCGKRTPLTTAISRDEGKTWENFKNIETDPLYEFTNPSCHFTSAGKVIIMYEASKMDNPNPPGRLGRSCMPLKSAVADIDWFYS